MRRRPMATAGRVGLVLLVAALCVLMVLAVWLVLLTAMHEPCEADPSSPAARFCDTAFPGGWILALVGLPVVAILLVRAEWRRRGWRRPLIALGVILAILTAMGGVAQTLRTACTDAQLRAYERWEDRPAPRGPPPVDCEADTH